jgi:NACalpha-BTF3-like transcription factor
MFNLSKKYMRIDNKFNIGDSVFYPAADLRSGKLIKSLVTGLLITRVGDVDEVAYQTKDSAYAIKDTDVFDNVVEAKGRLVEVFKEYRTKVLKSVDDAIKAAKKAKPEEILFDGTVDPNVETSTEETD